MQTDEPGQPPPETSDEVEATYAAQDAARAAAIATVDAGTATPEQEREVNKYGPGSK